MPHPLAGRPQTAEHVAKRLASPGFSSPERAKNISRALRTDPVPRFWAKVDKDGPVPSYRPDLGPCWLWTATCTGDGYGRFSVAQQPVNAHRWAWENAGLVIPDGLELDHLCRVRHCVNPSHLEPVTKLENARRGERANSRKTHCPQGHEYAGRNLYVDRTGRRHCKACVREAKRRYRHAHRQ